MTTFHMRALKVDLLHRRNTQPLASQALIQATTGLSVQLYDTAPRHPADDDEYDSASR